ncbi:GALNT [Lepeophtheirus salmonis]|uniref:Polypeptide N-acetylgalactosaminyltransferase n=1 Tax=Lepeophtheirus salmonis TaxID=72036 RepID=A0A7R8H068_LEPSM|nr:GALNT [Lepeophtheirus salmonis]CAF2763613.1 GALNT [Lepeophtheirus salmonis]
MHNGNENRLEKARLTCINNLVVVDPYHYPPHIIQVWFLTTYYSDVRLELGIIPPGRLRLCVLLSSYSRPPFRLFMIRRASSITICMNHNKSDEIENIMKSMFVPRRHRNTLIKIFISVPTIFYLMYLISLRLTSPSSLRSDPSKDPKDSNIHPENIHRELNAKNKEASGDDPEIKIDTLPPPVKGRANEGPNHAPKKHPKEKPLIVSNVIKPNVVKDVPGENGEPVRIENPSPEIKALIDKGWADNAFNQYVSDMISIHRTLPDIRDDWCKADGRFLTNLPSTSVIICFHNEAWSVLIRTVHSVLDRSPSHLIKEIILVDDASTQDHLLKPLDEYVNKHEKLRIVREPTRVGLIRARISGARASKGEVLTFLDSHCECTKRWLEPLLDRIARNKTNVVCPVIDVINDATLEYHHGGSAVNVGGFDWNLQFNWHSLPEREKKKKHSHPAEAVASPTMAGGLFSIDRNYFAKLGTYDSGFDIWGGENLELSFKTWMCGGTLEIVPCSHVGHIFRKRSPYKWRTGVNVLRKNSVRLAEVWMDEYKKYYYDRIGNDLGNFGDVSSRKELRKNLECKSFHWYLKNIYPELFIPGEAIASGEIRNKVSTQCVDSAAKPDDMHKPLGLWPCHKQGGNQYWMMSKDGEIRREDSCMDYAGSDVILFPCHGSKGNQQWFYDHEEETLTHSPTHKCLSLNEKRDKLIMAVCDSKEPRQRWKFSTYNPSNRE